MSYATFAAVAGTTYRIAVDGFGAEMGVIVLHWGLLPANDHFTNATVLAGASGFVTARNTGATVEDREPRHADKPGGTSLWWQWTAPQSGTVVFDTFGSDFDTLLAIYTGNSVASLTSVAAKDDSGTEEVSLVSFDAVAGTTYRIVVDGFNEEMGTLMLRWGPPPDSFASWIAGLGLSGAAAAAVADPDADGLPNAAEYVLGGNPVEPAPSGRPAATVSGGNMVFTFMRYDAPETPDVTLTVEVGTDPATWPGIFLIGPATGTSGPGVIIVENGTGPDTITVNIPNGTDKAKCARLKVTISQ